MCRVYAQYIPSSTPINDIGLTIHDVIPFRRRKWKQILVLNQECSLNWAKIWSLMAQRISHQSSCRISSARGDLIWFFVGLLGVFLIIPVLIELRLVVAFKARRHKRICGMEGKERRGQHSSGSSYLSPLRKQFPPTTTLQMLPRSSVIQ